MDVSCLYTRITHIFNWHLFKAYFVELFSPVAQSTAMEQKLNSKAAALTVLSEELEKCRIERDHLKIILENKMLHNTYNRVNHCSYQMVDYTLKLCFTFRTIS